MQKIKFLFAALLLVVFTSPAFAATDLSCSGAFNADGYVADGSFQVCGQDVALNTFTLGLGNLAYNVPSIRAIYDTLGVPVAAQSEGSVVASLPIWSVSKAVVYIGMLLTLGAFAWRAWHSGVQIMKQGGLAELARSPETWKAGGVLAMVALLSYQVDGLIIGQLLVVYLFLQSLAVVSFLLSSMISVFDFSATVSEEALSDMNGFEGEANQFATAIISTSLAAQNTALLNNFAFSGFDGVEHKKIKESGDALGNSLGDILDRLKALLGVMDDSPSTLSDYISGRFGDTVAMIPHPKILGPATNAGLALALKDSGFLPQRYWSTGAGSSGSEFPYWLHSKDISGLFASQYLLTTSPAINTSSTYGGMSGRKFSDLVSEVNPYAQKLISRWGSAVEHNDAVIRSMAEEIQAKLKSVKGTDVTKEDIINAIQMIAFGAIYPQKAQLGNGAMDYLYFNPLTAPSALANGDNNKISDKIFRAGFEAANHLRAANCLQRLGDYKADVIAWYALNKDDDQSSKLGDRAMDVFQNNAFMGQCLTVIPSQSGNGYVVDFIFGLNDLGTAPTPEGKEIRKYLREVMKVAIENGQPIDFAAKAMTNELKASGSILAAAELDAARAQKRILENYFRTIALTSNRALLGAVEANENDESKNLLASIRKQGVMGLGSYILQLSDIQKAFSSAIGGGSPDLRTNTYVSSPTGTMVMREGTKELIDLAFGEDQPLFVGGAYADQMAQLGSDQPASLAVSKGVHNIEAESADSMSSAASYITDLLIPGDDILKDGFGFAKDEDLVVSLSRCSTSLNCVDFNQHPLATVSLFGKNLVSTGLVIKAADVAIQALDSFLSNNAGSLTEVDSNSGSIGRLLGKAASALKLLKFTTVGGVLIAFMHIIAGISGIASSLASGFLLAGVFLGYLLPFMPMMAMFLMCLAWIAEGLLLFLSVPLFLPLTIMTREGGSPLFKPTSVVSMFAAFFLRGPLIFIGFLIFYSLSYGSIYAANSLIFNTIGSSDLGDSWWLVRTVEYLIMFLLLGVLYHQTFKTLTDIMVKTPDYVLSNIGAKGLSVSVSNGWEQMIQSRVISSNLERPLTEASRGLKKAGDDTATDREYDRIAATLKEKHGIDLDDYVRRLE